MPSPSSSVGREGTIVRLLLQSLGVAAMALAGIVTLTLLDAWTGDLGALLWVCAAFFFPFVAGIAWGARGHGVFGRAVGGVIGAIVAVVPGAVYAALGRIDPAAVQLPLLWGAFGPLALAQGALALPVGARTRHRRPFPT